MEDRRSDAADRRPEQKTGHLRRAIQAERFTLPVRRGRVDEEAPGSGVVGGGGEPLEGAQDDERGRARGEQREREERRVDEQCRDHDRLARRPVGDPAEHRLGDEARRRPGGDDQPEGRHIDPARGQIERQDRQERAEPEPDHEFREEQRQDRLPAGQPGGEARAESGQRPWVSGGLGRSDRPTVAVADRGRAAIVARVDLARGGFPRPGTPGHGPSRSVPALRRGPYHRVVLSPALLALALVLFILLLAPVVPSATVGLVAPSGRRLSRRDAPRRAAGARSCPASAATSARCSHSPT